MYGLVNREVVWAGSRLRTGSAIKLVAWDCYTWTFPHNFSGLRAYSQWTSVLAFSSSQRNWYHWFLWCYSHWATPNIKGKITNSKRYVHCEWTLRLSLGSIHIEWLHLHNLKIFLYILSENLHQGSCSSFILISIKFAPLFGINVRITCVPAGSSIFQNYWPNTMFPWKCNAELMLFHGDENLRIKKQPSSLF